MQKANYTRVSPNHKNKELKEYVITNWIKSTQFLKPI